MNTSILSPQQRKRYDEKGFFVARQLFSPEEAKSLREHFMALRAAGTYPGDMVADAPRADDPLARFPRMIQMHRWDERARAFLLDARIAVEMEAGDVLFFNGSLVHGSSPNTTRERFRASLIGHYVGADTQTLTEFDQPVLTPRGEELFLEPALDGVPCGEWTDLDRNPHIVLQGRIGDSQDV